VQASQLPLENRGSAIYRWALGCVVSKEPMTSRHGGVVRLGEPPPMDRLG
jgi:hypothetical protein